MVLGSFRADDQPIGDLTIRQALSDERQHFRFTLY